jgi:hypothetical protein
VENDRFKLENGYFLPKLAPMAQEWQPFITRFFDLRSKSGYIFIKIGEISNDIPRFSEN